MKNQRIVKAYDSINPSPAEKERMLRSILAEAPPMEELKRKKKPVLYTGRPAKISRGSLFAGIAACIAAFLICGIVLSHMGRIQPDDPSVLQPAAASTEGVISEKTTRDHYAPVLEKYRRAISEGWTKEQCKIEGISLRMQAGADVSKTGYAFLDLDGDGREELIIAEESTSQIDNIRDLYTTLEDGTPIQLWVDEMDGGQCRLHEDNIISISYSMNDEMDLTFYRLEAGQFVMRKMLQWEDEDTVFYTDADGNTRQVTSGEGQAIGYAYDHQKLSLTWLADVPDYLRDTDAVERYTLVLEKYKTAILENWTAEQCEQNDISPQILDETTITHNLGWCLLDIDKNGVEELVISDGVHLFDLYVMQPHNGGPGHLIMANGGETYQLCENGVIQMQGFYSGTTAWRYYTLSDTDLVQRDMVFYEGSSNQYSYGTDDDSLKPISKDEVGNIIVGERTAELTLTPFVEQPSFEPDEMEYYEPLLDIYRQAIREDWGPGLCVENGISLMVGNYGDFVEELGYTTMDLDNNGIQELIITDGTNIYDLYTIIQDETDGPLRLVDAMERIEYFLTTDGWIYCMGSGSASVSYYTLYSLEGRELKLLEGYMMDYETNPDAPWYYYDGAEQGAPCPREIAAAATDSITFAQIPFTSFK